MGPLLFHGSPIPLSNPGQKLYLLQVQRPSREIEVYGFIRIGIWAVSSPF